MDINLQIADHSNYSNTDFEPKLAVVVPIFRHSVLVTEAIESVLAQSAEFGIQTILVNDGCEFAETDQVCRDYQMAYPTRITYLRKSNGGLSDARNHGIKFALSSWSSVEAIYLLDADNRLRPTALENAMNALECAPNADWIYPNIDMIGLSQAVDFGGDYSRLIHSKINICEAGSLVRRCVFEAGVYFDTDFKSGFEDWDFFLSAAAAGFRGKNIENFGFLYRKRPDSMLAEAEQERGSILSELHKKHKSLFTPKSLIELEQHELPRYAIFLADKNEVLLTVDPDASDCQRISIKEYEELWWRGQTGNSRSHVPSFFVVTTTPVLNALRQLGYLHCAFWQMEIKLHDVQISGVKIENSSENRLAWDTLDQRSGTQFSADILMIEPKILADIFKDHSTSWLATLTTQNSEVLNSISRLTIPTALEIDEPIGNGRALYDLLPAVAYMQNSPLSFASKANWDWREPGVQPREKAFEITRDLTNCKAAYPRVVESGMHVGFILPLVEFGGVERVALNIAKAMREQGYSPHLFVIERTNCLYTPEWHDSFESVTFLDESSFSAWGPSSNHFMGTDVPDWSRWGPQQNAVAMLSWLDVVVNFHGGAISGIMGKLKRLGVKTILSLHLHDLSPFKRPVGNSYLGLSFEHAYDFFLPCSRQLGDWLHGMGVPKNKIVPVVNAPSFPILETELKQCLLKRAKRCTTEPLRVMYLGRLDAQKGILRLNQVFHSSKNLELEWRIIGAAVLEEGFGEVDPELMSRLEDAITVPQELAATYEWADVIVLLSEYEGLPLTILEAMRQGVVPIATNVGAVSEVVRNNENGILLDLDDAISGSLLALNKMNEDRDFLKKMSERASSDLANCNWNNAISGFLEKLTEAEKV